MSLLTTGVLLVEVIVVMVMGIFIRMFVALFNIGIFMTGRMLGLVTMPVFVLMTMAMTVTMIMVTVTMTVTKP